MEDVFEGSQPGGREATQGAPAIIQAGDESGQVRMMAAVITEGGQSQSHLRVQIKRTW